MWLAADRVAVPALPPRSAWPSIVIAVPACNERNDIGACLAALAAAARRTAAPVTIVVNANNCTDDTAAVARRCEARGATLVIDEITLPPVLAHAGGARRHAMERAASLAGSDGIIMTTDADSRVDADWIVANLAEIAGGADAVAGMVTFDDNARDLLPMLVGRAAEWRLACLQARIEHLLDPRAHDPWPRHIWAWGASLAVTVKAYRAVGGLPAVPLAEDRALAAALERGGFRLRRSHAPLVFTSPRRTGRAPGGFADLLASYASDETAPCDAALEPTRVLLRRLTWRARLRAAAAADAFGEIWAAIEEATPALARRRVRPVDLTAEIASAEGLIAALERRAARRAGNPVAGLAA